MSKSSNSLNKVRTYFYKVSEVLAYASGILFFLYMLNIVADVTGRYLFLYPILGTVEIGEAIALPVGVFFALAIVQATKQNIRVTFLTDKLKPVAKFWFEFITILTALLFIGVLGYYLFGFAVDSLAVHEAGEILGVPVYFGKFAAFTGCILLCIQLLIDIVTLLIRKNLPPDLASNGVKQ